MTQVSLEATGPEIGPRSPWAAWFPWVVIGLAYVSAWYFPISWAWRWFAPETTIPAGIDGPVSWVERWWTDRDSPMLHFWLVGPAASWLAWTHRSAATMAWRRTMACPSALLRRWERGRFVPIALSLALLLFGHLVHVATLATIALALLPWALVRATHGPMVARSLLPVWICIACLAMPPETVPTKWNAGAANLVCKGVAAAGRLLGFDIEARGWTVRMGLKVLPLAGSGGAAAATSLAVFATIVRALARKHGLGSTGIRALFAAGTAYGLVVLQSTVALASPDAVGKAIADIPGLWTAPCAFGAPLLCERLMARIRVRMPAPLNRLLRRIARRWRVYGLPANQARRRLQSRIMRPVHRWNRAIDRALDAGGRRIGRGLSPLRRPMARLGRWLDRMADAGGRGLTRAALPFERLLAQLERALRFSGRRRGADRGTRR